MDLYSTPNNTTNEIVVMGNVTSNIDRTNLISELIAKKGSIKIISFIDARVLPCDVLDALSSNGILNSSNIRMDVYNSFLYSYLRRLGINNVFIKKTNYSVTTNSSNIDKFANDFSDEKILVFLSLLKEKYDYDFQNYRLESVKRRIKIAMSKAGYNYLPDYLDSVINNNSMFEELFLELSINVTEFFRDFEILQHVQQKIFPQLDSFPQIKIWCAGCSTGEEPYSLAIMLDECKLLDKSIIYATDFNGYVIEEAKNGCYSYEKIIAGDVNRSKNFEYGQDATSNIAKYTQSRSDTHATPTFQRHTPQPLANYFYDNGFYMKINKRLKEKVLFYQHSLLENGIINEFQLIFCRNVLIYFDYNLQKQVLRLLKNSLDTSGFLVLGKSESIDINDSSHMFDHINKKYKLYKNRC